MLVHLIVALVALALVATLIGRLETTSFSSFGIRVRYVLLVSRLREAGDLAMKAGADELKAEKLAHVEKAREIAAKAEAENRDFTPEERKAVTDALEAAKNVHQRILEKDGDAALLEQINALGQPVGDLAKNGGGRRGRGKTAGERFTDAEEFKAWFKSIAPTGDIPGGEFTRVGNGPPVAFDGIKDLLDGVGFKDALTTGVSDTSAGALVRADWLGLIDSGTFMRPLVMRNLVTNGTTGSDAIEYARETTVTNNAAPVAEATSDATIGDGTGGTVLAAAGGLKPKSQFELEKVSTTVKTIAHWLPATKRALSDAAQIRTLIDNFLRYGLEEELEDQITNGDGTGENFEGILNVSGVQAQAWDTSLFVTTRKAKTKVRTVGRATATAFVLNPEDNERVDLEQDANDRFYGNGPFGLGPDVLWGIPRIESEAVPAGTGIVADWRRAVLWDREQAAVQVSDSHADFFVRNLVAILAEMRAAFGVIRPKAFVVIDLTA